MTISFTGHSFIPSKAAVKEIVKEQIGIIAKDADCVTCYLGGYGDFDEICATVCRELKEEYSIELVYVTPYINLSAQAKIKENEKCRLYDLSIYPPIENVPPKLAILKRNEWMVTNADIVIAYVNRSYGGAYKSLLTARRKKKKIINVCTFL